MRPLPRAPIIRATVLDGGAIAAIVWALHLCVCVAAAFPSLGGERVWRSFEGFSISRAAGVLTSQ